MNWRPSADLDVVRLRARMLGRVRAFFSEREVLEVETPIVSSAASTDPHLASLTTRYTGPTAPRGQTLYLHTSPEFPMKRLLAASSGSIYQICKVFRDGEAGRLHNPEFTMVEWYRLGFDHHQLMDDVAALVNYVLTDRPMARAPEKLSYRDSFLRHAGLDPDGADVNALRERAQQLAISIPDNMPVDDPDPWRDLLLTHAIEPQLGRGGLTFLYDYPASQAALARLRADAFPVGERFELYMEGIEIANGFHELGDAAEQRRRFDAELERRHRKGQLPVPKDERLLAALDNGLPSCAGVALGFDRLAMIAAGVRSIQEVLAFPIDRA